MNKHDPEKPPRRWKLRRGKTASIRTRVLRVALIPGLALIVLWAITAVYLGGTALYNQQVGKGVQQFAGPAITGLSSIQKERQLSIAFLANKKGSIDELLTQQKQSDAGMAQAQANSTELLKNAPDEVNNGMFKLAGYLAQMPGIRGKVVGRATTIDEVTKFYDGLLDSATELFGAQARALTDASSMPGAIAATNTFQVSDGMSRSGSLISGALASGRLDQGTYLQFVNLVGAYHSLANNIEADLLPDVQNQYKQLIASKPWHDLVAAENNMIQGGAWPSPPPGAPSLETWQNLTNQVSAGLSQMTIQQSTEIGQKLLDEGNKQVLQLAIVLGLALLGVIASIWWARRQSTVLVNSALVTRLAKLRSDAQDLVTVRLPDMVRRLRRGEQVDTQEDLPELHYGESDEIGQVASSISTALREAVTAAAGEAEARNALNKLFLGIARRNQLPLYNLLNLLDSLEQSEQDSAALERLYRLDHEATRARRNSENLIILSGGDIGQHLPGPIRMREVLRSAISETHEYKRFKIKGSVPDVAISSDAATGLIHLIAELLENAARFSSPTYEVLVKTVPAQAGVIVEVEDRGLGIPEERRERLNTMLAEPPDLDVTAIGDGSQLGFWVIASLVKRFGFKVALRESDYGGTLAIVRIPTTLLMNDDDASDNAAAARGNGIARLFAEPSSTGVGMAAVGAVPGARTSVDSGADRRHAREDDTTIMPRVPGGGGVDPMPPVPVAATPLTPPPARAPEPEPVVSDWFQAPPELSMPAPQSNGNGNGNGNGHLRNGGWPDAEPAREAPQLTVGGRAPLPQRSPGGHLNPRLADEPSGLSRPAANESESALRDVGAALGAFQQGSEAGRRVGDGRPTQTGTADQ